MSNENEANPFPYDSDEAKLPCSSSYIRLLELQPSIPEASDSNSATSHYNSALRLTIQTAPLDSPPPYTALSYTWGAPTFTHPIHLNNHPFLVTPSLSTALRHLRSQTAPLLIWIDQISINQLDNLEKSHQVNLMDRVYKASSQVFIWLGPAQDNSDDIMDVFAQVGQAALDIKFQDYFTAEGLPVLQSVKAKRDPEDQRWRQLEAVLQIAGAGLKRCLHALAAWDKRPWMSRVWVIQEFCLGVNADFVCGHRRVPVDLVKFTRFLFMWADVRMDYAEMTVWHTIVMNDPTSNLFGARAQRQKFERGVGMGDTLIALLRKSYVERGALATDPRDRVFGLLGMAQDAKEIGVVADYTKPMAQALTDVARALVQAGHVEILSYLRFPKDQHGLPFWVPDWQPNMRPSFYPHPKPGTPHVYSASGDLQSVVLTTTDPKMLGLKGFLVDTVEDVGSVATVQVGEKDHVQDRYEPFLAQIRFLCKISAQKNESIYTSAERRNEGVWRIPIGDIYESQQTEQIIRGDAQVAKAFEDWSMILKWFEVIKTTSSEAELEEVHNMWPSDVASSGYRLSMLKMNGMRPYITEKGYVGLGPSITLPGDVVVVMLGARVCSVLRHKARPDGKGTYFLLGEAYCDGVMDGELVGHRDEDDFYLL